jgi:hypothetical protein
MAVWWNCSANKSNSGLLFKMDWITGIFLCRQNGNHPEKDVEKVMNIPRKI